MVSEISPGPALHYSIAAIERPEAAAVDAGARAEALSWSPNTRRAYVAGWKDFTSWCFDNRRPGLAATPVDVGRYPEDMVEQQGRTLATARLRLAAIAAAHRLGKHPDPRSAPLVKATLKRLAREHGKPRRQSKGLTSYALAAVKATARIQWVHQGKRRRKETETEATKRTQVDLALLQVMRDGLLRRSGGPRWICTRTAPDACTSPGPRRTSRPRERCST